MSQVPLHIVNQADARAFIESQPTLKKIHGKSLNQLRLVASLFVQDSTILTKTLCVRYIAKAIEEQWEEYGVHPTLPTAGVELGARSRSSSLASLITQEEYARASAPQILNLQVA